MTPAMAAVAPSVTSTRPAQKAFFIERIPLFVEKKHTETCSCGKDKTPAGSACRICFFFTQLEGKERFCRDFATRSWSIPRSTVSRQGGLDGWPSAAQRTGFSRDFYSMRIDKIAVGRNAPDDVNVIVEVPIGGEPIKYELDKESGTLVVDRFLYTSMRYPGNYGFIPHTLSGDGDPVDVLIANSRAIVPGAVMSARPVGVLLMEDNAGMDEKIVAVPSSHITQRFDAVASYSDLPEITVKQIEHFFAHYKDLEPGKWVKIIRWGDAAEARKLIMDGVERARKKP